VTGGSQSAFTPGPDAQSAIKKVVKSGKEPMFLERMHVLGEKYTRRREQLVLELAYYTSRATDVDEAMVPHFIARQVGINDNDIVRALAPYLGADDRRFRETARDWIQAADEGLRGKNQGTKHLRALMEASVRRNEPIPWSLSEFLFHTNPSAGLHDFVSVYLAQDPDAAKKLLWSDHVVQDLVWRREHRFDKEFRDLLPAGLNELAWLASQKEWWVRLYVAVIVRKYPNLGTAEITAKLKDDPHEIVRKAIQ
jgi:hypothetical protein